MKFVCGSLDKLIHVEGYDKCKHKQRFEKYKTKKIIIKILESLKRISYLFTLFYMWLAASHYLALNVNVVSGNACFYGGVITAILTYATLGFKACGVK